MTSNTYSIYSDHQRPLQAPLSPSRGPLPGPRSGADHNSWLRSKREHDTQHDNSKLWRIHGKLYDLANFVKFHPGGQQWIQWTQGHDCTESYESHHLNSTKVDAILQQFYVKDCKDDGVLQPPEPPPTSHDTTTTMTSTTTTAHHHHTKENSLARLRALQLPKPTVDTTLPSNTFTYNPTDLYSTLKQRVLHTLMTATQALTVSEATGPSTSMKWACGVIVAQFLITHTLAARLGSWFWSACAGFSLVGCWGVGHNAMHQADSTWQWWRYAVDLTTWSSRTTRITHVLSHHQYPNLHQDWEVTSIEKAFSFMPDSIDSNQTSNVLGRSWPLLLAATAWQTALRKLTWLSHALTRKGWQHVRGSSTRTLSFCTFCTFCNTFFINNLFFYWCRCIWMSGFMSCQHCSCFTMLGIKDY